MISLLQTELKESAIAERIIGWAEDWEKELNQKNTAVAKAIFTNKYKDITFDLWDLDNSTFYVSK